MMAAAAPLAPAGSLHARLVRACGADWRRYVAHPFVQALGRGTLPAPAFRRYLVQDYLFLVHFARAYGLAAYKSETLEDMRAAAATLSALVGHEMSLHLDYCRGWGLGEADILAVPEAPETTAYTRYVLERGAAGDHLDLLVALAPCVVGYAEIGLRLARRKAALGPSNPYAKWIATYGGEAYQDVARAAVRQLDRVAARRLGGTRGAPRFASLALTFAHATRLEAGFWDMGLGRAPSPAPGRRVGRRVGR